MMMRLLPPVLALGAALVLNTFKTEAPPPAPPVPGVPKGWSVSDEVGKRYMVGYDKATKATYIESVGVPGWMAENQRVNELTVPAASAVGYRPGFAMRTDRLPYSDFGFGPGMKWAAALGQSFSGAPFAHRTVTVDADVRNDNFEGEAEFYLTTPGPNDRISIAPKPGQWQHVSLSLNNVTQYYQSVRGKTSLVNVGDRTLSVGLAIAGRGRIWVRNVQVKAGAALPPPDPANPIKPIPESFPLYVGFGSPKPNPAPVNLELQP